MPEGLFETPATLNDTWGYKTFDNNWKGAARVIQLKHHLNERGINYLLNVGPDYLGRIPAPAAGEEGCTSRIPITAPALPFTP